MKKSLLAIALAVASVPLIFAAPQSAPAGSNANSTATNTTKKHVKKTHKGKKTGAAATAKPATPSK